MEEEEEEEEEDVDVECAEEGKYESIRNVHWDRLVYR